MKVSFLKNAREDLISTFFSKTVGKNAQICKAIFKAGGGFID